MAVVGQSILIVIVTRTGLTARDSRARHTRKITHIIEKTVGSELFYFTRYPPTPPPLLRGSPLPPPRSVTQNNTTAEQCMPPCEKGTAKPVSTADTRTHRQTSAIPTQQGVCTEEGAELPAGG